MRCRLTSSRWTAVFIAGLLSGTAASRADTYFTVTPCRVFDSRLPANAPSLPGLIDRPIQVVGKCGIPAGASAISINATVTNATVGGDLEISRGDEILPDPATTRVSYQPNKTRANNGVVQLASWASQSPADLGCGHHVDLILDVNGFFLGQPVAVADPRHREGHRAERQQGHRSPLTTRSRRVS